MNDNKYGRLYPERAVAPLREMMLQLSENGTIRGKVESDCLDALDKLDALGFPPDEPLLLLRGQDELASDAVRFYADLVDHRLAGHGSPEAGFDKDHIIAIADAMERWRPRKLPD